jgi:hypothetical protein
MSGGDDTFLDVSTFTYGRPRKKKKPAKFRWFLVTQKRRLKNIFFFSFLKKHKMKSVWAKKKKTDGRLQTRLKRPPRSFFSGRAAAAVALIFNPRACF